MKTTIITVFILLILNCSPKNDYKEIWSGGYMMKGNFINEKPLGLIKYYDKKGMLCFEKTFVDGLEYGTAKTYYSNGSIKLMVNQINGAKNGYLTKYDSSGKILSKQFFYMDHACGGSYDYRNEKLTSYEFYSFDGDRLIHVDYDSTEIPSTFFKIRQPQVFLKVKLLEGSTNSGFFMFTPDPPKLKFSYKIYTTTRDWQIIDSSILTTGALFVEEDSSLLATKNYIVSDFYIDPVSGETKSLGSQRIGY